MTRRAWRSLGWTARLLVLGALTSVVASGWLGYRAVRGWRESARLLAEQRAGEWADRLTTVLGRDMRGVQTMVLASAEWDRTMVESPYDVRVLAASAFARYPYPESFFAWRGWPPSGDAVFLDRSDRRPAWATGTPPLDPFPVIVEREPGVAGRLLSRIGRDVAERQRFSAFEMELAGSRYQVVVRLLYRDALRERPDGVFGFTVNLAWVREHYFPEVTRQVGRMSSGGSPLALAVLDAAGQRVAGPPGDPAGGPARRREFPLAFFDPQLVAVHRPGDLPVETWAAVADAGGDPVLGDAVRAGTRTLVLAAAAMLVFALGLLMTVRAVQARAALAQLRAEFVASVTHELKTPIATIRAAGDTIARGRVSTPVALRDYASLVVQESKRLARLVDNLLAYSRITDVTEAYDFTTLDVASLVDDAVAGFRGTLESAGFDVEIDLPADVPAVRGDRTACLLLLDNLLDNVVRYSPSKRWLGIRARTAPPLVVVEVADHGMGIPAAELPFVTRRFFRGRRSGRGGSGLGLAIARRIAQDHGGAIRIESEVEKGTTVSVSLPAAGAGDVEANPDR